MKKILAFVGLMAIATAAYAAVGADIINWGFGGIERAREWVSPDGRLSMQNRLQESTSLDLWASPTPPTDHSFSEITLHRNTYGLSYDERLNVSAMVHANGGAYRFGVERSGSGQFRDMIFCFEDVTPGVAYCPFKITPTGAYASGDGGLTWRRL